MTDEEKQQFSYLVKYYWEEKGEMDRFAGFTVEKLEECDYALAEAYRRYEGAQKTIDTLVGRI